MRRELIELKNERTTLLESAEALLKEGKREDYRSKMEQICNLNDKIKDAEDLVREQDRKFLEKTPDVKEEHEKALERAEVLKKGGEVQFSAKETMRDLYLASKQTTLATGAVVQPTGAGSMIRDPLGNVVCSIVDEVYVQDLDGMGAYLEPYVISEIDAKGGKVTTNAGKARTASADPTFGVAKISPYEVNVTSFVDKNISRLSPASYYAKVHGMAMRAMRRKIAEMIFNGDGQSSPDMFGIKNAKNVAGGTIFQKLDGAKIDENLLTDLFFGYGGDETIGANARLYLNKKDLLAIGKLRNGDKERIYKIMPDGGNPNRGTIVDGGTMIPYSISSALTALDGASATNQTMAYGDPMNYELGLFGPYTIRVDESVKAVERMYAILGDAMVGGNLVVDKGFVVATAAGA